MSLALRRFRTPLIAVAYVALIAALGWFITSDYVLSVIVVIGIFSIAGVGLDLAVGFGGMLALGQGAFMAVGGYGAALLTTRLGWTPLLALVASVVAVAILAWVVALATSRLQPAYLAIVTLALAIITQNVIVAMQGVTGGATGISGVPAFSLGGLVFDSQPLNFWLVWGVLGVGLLLAGNITRGPLGAALRATQRDELAANILGIPTTRLKAKTFVAAGIFAGVAGALYAFYTQFISPEMVGWVISVGLVTMLVLGGTGTLWGAIIGVGLLQSLPEIADSLGQYILLIEGAVLILTLMFWRAGIAGGLISLVRRLAPRSAPEIPPSAGSTARVIPASDGPAAAGEPLLACEGLTKSFSGVQALAGVTFAVPEHSIKALIGPNGSGKTTCLNLISGVLLPDSGSITFAGDRFSDRLPDELARAGLVRSFQRPRPFRGLSTLDNVAIGQSRHLPCGYVENLARLPRVAAGTRQARSVAMECLDRVGLADVAGKPADALSSGQEKLLEVARGLATRPRLLVLDEPAAGLNDRETGQLAEVLLTLRDEGLTFVIVEHNMAFVMAIADSIAVLNFGHLIADDAPEKVRADEAVLAAYLSTRRAGAA